MWNRSEPTPGRKLHCLVFGQKTARLENVCLTAENAIGWIHRQSLESSSSSGSKYNRRGVGLAHFN